VTGYAAAAIRASLDTLFAGLRAPVLWGLIEEELGHRQALDTFVPRRHLAGRCRAYGPRLTVVSCAGNVPVASLPSLVHCLLVKSACLVRVSHAEPLLPSLYLRSLAEEAPWLAGSVAAVTWESADDPGVEAWIGYGSDETLAAIRRSLPEHVRFLPHGHRIGFGVIARERLSREALHQTAAAAAADVAIFDQQGCVSPRIFFVEKGDPQSAREFARALAYQLEALRVPLPRRKLDAGEAAALHQQRAAVEMRQLSGEPVALFHSAPGTDWTVILDPRADLSTAGSHRTAVIRPLQHLTDLRPLLAPFRPYLQTAAVAAPVDRWPALAALLADSGVTRLCPLGRTQHPAPGWHHDGRPSLAALVRWVDWEDG
jgi:hypothetical protein